MEQAHVVEQAPQEPQLAQKASIGAENIQTVKQRATTFKKSKDGLNVNILIHKFKIRVRSTS